MQANAEIYVGALTGLSLKISGVIMESFTATSNNRHLDGPTPIPLVTGALASTMTLGYVGSGFTVHAQS